MCGIFCSLSHHGHIYPDEATKALLIHRGPDSHGLREMCVQPKGGPELHATFFSTVLSLRGTSIVEQPLGSPQHRSFLCWNGEAWWVAGSAPEGNDSQRVFEILLAMSAETSKDYRSSSVPEIINLLCSFRGPYSFVFYDGNHGYLYYGRDCLGRRSLLKRTTDHGDLVLSSVCDNTGGEGWTEVEADGIYVVDFLAPPPMQTIHIPHRRMDEDRDAMCFVGKFLLMRKFANFPRLSHSLQLTGPYLTALVTRKLNTCRR